jgi:hypothetical protein
MGLIMGDNHSNLAQAMAEFAAYSSVAIPQSSLQPVLSQSVGTSANIPSQDKPIQGEMLTVRKMITPELWEDTPREEIKRQMLSLMVEEMMKSKHIEFTVTQDHSGMGTVRIAARIFVTPDSQVKLLRERGY